MPIILGIKWLLRQLKTKSYKKKKATHLSATIVVKLAVLQMPVMLQVSGVIHLTFMCSIVMISNIKTDTVCIQVATVFTLVQVLDGTTYYRVVH